MKVTFDIECTPQEARQFFGQPDVQPMQEALMKDLEDKLRDNMNSLDPETMLKTWLPATIQGWGEVQKLFWEQMGMKAGMPGGVDMSAKSGAKSSKSK